MGWLGSRGIRLCRGAANGRNWAFAAHKSARFFLQALDPPCAILSALAAVFIQWIIFLLHLWSAFYAREVRAGRTNGMVDEINPSMVIPHASEEFSLLIALSGSAESAVRLTAVVLFADSLVVSNPLPMPINDQCSVDRLPPD